MTDNQKEKIKRLIYLRQLMGFNQAQMAQKIGVSQPKLSAIEKGREGKDILNGIFYRLSYEFNIKKEWWEDGEGDVFLQKDELQPLVSDKPENGFMPVFDVDFTAGFSFQYLENYGKPEIMGYVNFNELKGSKYIVRAKGNSMSPFINDRDFVGIRPVINKSIIDYGNVYGVITSDLAVFKRIKKGTTSEAINLISDNPDFEPYEILKVDVIELYIVVGSICVRSNTF